MKQHKRNFPNNHVPPGNWGGWTDINSLSVPPLRNFMLACLPFGRSICVSKWGNVDSFMGDRSCVSVWGWRRALMLPAGITSIWLNTDTPPGSGNSKLLVFWRLGGQTYQEIYIHAVVLVLFQKYLLLAAVGGWIDLLYL